MVSKQEKTSGLKLSVISVLKNSELKDEFATVFVNRVLTKARQRLRFQKKFKKLLRKAKREQPSSEQITSEEKLSWKEYIVHEYECEFY